ncbi:hypothetical protein KSD_47980 [Ktedonobacter sp. SOSP1-85]|uniref:pentapeptide repeat-containing protein n=1 Tax=Ktedonobacter sp. SOSP1-85 TaxID=2778367 RepID=UPI0019167C6A|nr:pentapeptide repeat-containing protein [Ktedonobacter sp. SOSP1-85]GHO77027.1 hypothetical protein KSD_47980 [Ktedonobacter sp. SOSP1-85]
MSTAHQQQLVTSLNGKQAIAQHLAHLQAKRQQSLALPPKKFRVAWTGFSGKTLWDWLQLLAALAIPVVVAAGTIWFSYQQSETSLQISQVQHKNDQQNIDDQQQEVVLKTYLDDMSTLLLTYKLGQSQRDDEVRQVARAKTLTALRRLNGERKGILLRFLLDAELINKEYSNHRGFYYAIIDLTEANLEQADLMRIDLKGAILTGVDLQNANLQRAGLLRAALYQANLGNADLQNADLETAYMDLANLQGAHLEYARLNWAQIGYSNLQGAHLEYAEIQSADLESSNLRGANLQGVDLRGANLQGVDLRGANLQDTDLRGTNLQGANLQGANLQGAKKGPL